MAKRRATCVKRAIERAQDAARGMRVVHRRAEHEAVGLRSLGDQLVDHIVVDGALTAQLSALAAGDAVVDGLVAQPHGFRLNAVPLKRGGNLGERNRRVALLPRAAVNQQNLAHRNILSSG